MNALLVGIGLLGLAWILAAVWRYQRMLDWRRTIRDRADAFLREADAAGELDYPPAWQESEVAPRGIVICAGGRGLLTQAYTLLAVLRESHGCTLPIALFHVGREELPEACQRFFEARFPGLRCIDASALPARPGHPRGAPPAGFALKPFALLNAPFHEVLLLDADSVPLTDPSVLFDDPGYRAHGNLFWPDSCLMSTLVEHPAPYRVFSLRDGRSRSTTQSVNMRIYDHLRLPRPTTLERVSHETEAGQILVDRRRCFRSLQTCWFLAHWFRYFCLYFYGDKDLYRPAFGVAGQHFEQLPLRHLQAGRVEADVFEGLAMLPRDRGGEPVLLHQMHRKPSVDAPLPPLSHLVRDPVVDHPRSRRLRGVTMRVPVAELTAVEALPRSVRAVDEAIARARLELQARLDAAALPVAPVRRRLRRRRLLPW